ncbi:MAG: hypothetical protein F6K58_26875 [Symploca sp. SIO2E9]|nr:hypothetical protein [Symploca sp. SIO2E9]
MSEKKSGGRSKQTPRRPDAQTRRIKIPTKISLTREKVFSNEFAQIPFLLFPAWKF